MNYAIEQRLRFIDFIVNSYGYIQRRHLTEYFGISPACASMDFENYTKLAPGNLQYNLSQKRYEKGPDFKKVYE